MKILEERILKDGVIKAGDILKVDSFLNHQIDVDLYDQIGKEFYRLFSNEKITKVLTIESSGIGLAIAAAREFRVPALFAKKNRTRNIDGGVFATAVESYTNSVTYTVIVSKRFLSPSDHVLLIDDFLAKGHALLGLIDIVRQSGASIAGCGIAIEKGFQQGGKSIRAQGIRVESLAIIDAMDESGITFREQNNE